MNDFATAYMPYINFIVLVIGGLFLKRIINDKNSQIETLSKNFESTKALLDMYDLDKFTKHLDFTVKGLEERHKVEIEKIYKSSEEGVENKILELTSPWLVKYNELLNYQFRFLLQMTDEELEKVYKLLPENKEFIQYQIKAIKETDNLKELPKN